MGELANKLKNRPQGIHPSDIEIPRRDEKEFCKAIILRSGKELKAPLVQKMGKKKSNSIQDKVEKEQ